MLCNTQKYTNKAGMELTPPPPPPSQNMQKHVIVPLSQSAVSLK